MSLAVRYRPQSLAEVCGNKTTVEILKRTIANKNFKNVILFAGQSGAGKTTCARILAKEINGSLDGLIELDCASHNSVDDVRAIAATAAERSLTGTYKIFILDECHVFLAQAWNAFLKCIEDCPKHTIFIFCTTNPDKIPEAVKNRMQRYNISKIPATEIRDRLLYVCQQEGYTNYIEACDVISKRADGAMREALTLLEKCSDYSTDLSISNIQTVLGDSSYKTMIGLTCSILNTDEAQMINCLNAIEASGQNLKQFINIYMEFVLDLTKYILFQDINLTGIPAHLATKDNAIIQSLVQNSKLPSLQVSLNYYNALAEALLDLKFKIKYDDSYQATILITLIKFLRGST